MVALGSVWQRGAMFISCSSSFPHASSYFPYLPSAGLDLSRSRVWVSFPHRQALLGEAVRGWQQVGGCLHSVLPYGGITFLPPHLKSSKLNYHPHTGEIESVEVQCLQLVARVWCCVCSGPPLVLGQGSGVLGAAAGASVFFFTAGVNVY